MLRVAGSRVLRSAASSSQVLAAVCHRGAGVLATGECSSRQPSQAQHPCFSQRSFAAQAGGDDEEEVREVGSARVKRLVDDILQLSLLEVADLTQILQSRLGISALPVGGGFGGGGGQAAPAAEAAPAAPPVEEKTEFDLKLDGFEAAAKIKVIKEVRGMTDLGLKEAKELVEKAPQVLKKGLKKEEAEDLKKKLEAVGAKVSLQ